MTPQSNFMVLAPVAADRVAGLRQLLGTMNQSAGVVDPQNKLVPFGQFEQLHFARFVVLEDPTAGDIAQYGLPIVNYPTYLAFLGDLDGPQDEFFVELVQKAGSGLRKIFSCCEGFPANADLLHWINGHNVPPATFYINWVGRTVKQTREEKALRLALETFIQENAISLQAMSPRQVHDTLKRFAQGEQQAGRLTLTPVASTPWDWRISNFLNLVGVPIILLVLLPFLLLYSPFFIFQLRRREKSDPVIAPRIEPAHAQALAALEDHDVTNQFSAFGSLKPGVFRRWLLVFVLWIIDYTAKHIYNRGRLARVNTIQAARWTFLDDKRRLYFASNYDGSLDSYMDDFINKVAFGLNVVFGNGISYPRTSWMILGGAKDEQKFKYVLRRHQLPTEVWYNAHSGLTALNLQQNTLIRQGLEAASMTDTEIKEWLQLF